MRTEHKLLFIVAAMLTLLATATVVNVSLNFKEYAYSQSINKSQMAIDIIRDGLTAHMVNGVMQKRQEFLRAVVSTQNIEKLWIVRSDTVKKQFGPGFKSEQAHDAIDKEVINSGQPSNVVFEKENRTYLRSTIPYKASSFSTPNCLQCHEANEGEVLGAISVVFDIDDARDAETGSINKIILINLIFLLIAITLTSYYFKPYLRLFSDIQLAISNALHGDFSIRLSTRLQGEANEATQQINTLFSKLDSTFTEIKNSLTTFATQGKLLCADPIEESKNIIKELSDIYKFKKTIELDADKEAIIERFAYILEHKFALKKFALTEINVKTQSRHLLLQKNVEVACSDCGLDSAQECRAFRTNSDVISTDFPELCSLCATQSAHYICLPFAISSETSLVLSMFLESEAMVAEKTQLIHSIESYLETIKPVLESRLLTDRLLDSSLRDAPTTLFNRRFLDEFVENLNSSAQRNSITYSVLMLDIDYFKMVNDTYGHDIGDAVIRTLADIMKKSVRQSDLSIRFGGEEFLILLQNATKEGTLQIAQEIKSKFSQKEFIASNEKFHKTLSIGISYYPEHGNSIWKVIKFADTALYQAKHSGRNKIVVFEPAMYDGEKF